MTPIVNECDSILANVTSGESGVPGVIAMATNRAGNIYEGAAGERMCGDGDAMTTDTVVAIFSCTKGITGTAVMQLVEDGKLDLDAPAKKYAPGLEKIQVLEGFDAAGNPKLRPPKRDVTARMLMLHTAGFSYDFFNEDYLRLTSECGLPSIITCSKASLNAPLIFDPGEGWEYGISLDWCGQVVEGITGKRLGEVMQERIFTPLGMNDTGFTISPSMGKRLAAVHQRGQDGSLTPYPDPLTPLEPEVHMGGSGLFSTVGDYMRFIRMILNDGQGETGRILKASTVQQMAQNGLGTRKIKPFKGVIPALSNDAEFFPGMPKSWAYTFMINDETAPTGRPAGSLGWAGLANLFYWIDRRNGIGGFWATQILPFADVSSFTGYMEFETAVYQHM